MPTNESAPASTPLIQYSELPGAHPQAPIRSSVNPDNPPWGVLHALMTWGLSVGLLLFVPLFPVIPYVVYLVWRYGSTDALAGNTNVIFLSILGVLPAHLLTLLVVWLVVTSRGRRPFWSTLGWSWPEKFGLAQSIGMALVLPVGLLAMGWFITWYVGGAETQLDQVIKSSLKARYATAFLAAVTGPLVEELVYRGVLYAALERAIGVAKSVIVISLLFTSVHVAQYYNNLGVITVIAILSVVLTCVRARTGRLLPSYIIHLVFNGIQALLLVSQPFVERLAGQKATTGFLAQALSRLLA